MDDLRSAYGGLRGIAARLAMARMLDELYEVCENQKTVSASRLERIADRVQGKLIKEAVFVGNMANKVSMAQCTAPTKIAGGDRNICCLGVNHLCMLNVNDGFCVAASCQNMVTEAATQPER